MQIGWGPYSGGMPGAFATRVLDSSEVRIDYVQHALCAWLLYKQLFQSTEAATRQSPQSLVQGLSNRIQGHNHFSCHLLS